MGHGYVLVAVEEVFDGFVYLLRGGCDVVAAADLGVVAGEAELDLAQGLFLGEDDQLGELDQL